MPLSPGQRLGPYEVLAPLGAGGMGEVYRARDCRLGREVAIKVLPEGLAKDPAALARFESEARAVAALAHPNILDIHDFGEESGLSFIVTEVLDGETLRQRLGGSALPWRTALEIGLGVADGLASAHAHGVVHRDLKPDNVFLTFDGQVKILDFGLARLEAPKSLETSATVPTPTQSGTVMGTVGYMAPEQARGKKADERSDIFSLGCILYEMVAGRRAFIGDSPAEVFAAILKEEPTDPADLVADLPENVRMLILRCLSKYPDSRFQSARDLAFALKVGRTTPTPSQRRRADPKKTRVIAAVGVALVLAVLSVLTWKLAGRSGGRPAVASAAVDSLAVLPFVNASGNSDNQYLCDGLTESVINNLSQLPSLRVLPRTTVFSYKSDADLRRAGSDLGVRALVTGRVSLRGDNLVVQSELTDAKTGSQVWGKQYQEKLSEAFAVQQQIAQEISQSLRLKLSGEEERRLAKPHTPDPEAYLLYLNGRHHWNRRSGEGIGKSIEFFSRAIEKDPSYALPLVGLADAFTLLGFYGAVPPREAMPKARDAAVRALELDGTLAEAQITLADVRYLFDWDWPGAEAGFRRAIGMSPNYLTGRQWYSSFLAVQGRLAEAEDEIRKAQSLDPLNLVINTDVGMVHYYLDDYEGAVRQYRKVLDLDPDFVLAHMYLGLAHLRKGLPEKAVESFETAGRLDPGNPDQIALLAYAHAAAGRRKEAEAAIRTLTELGRHRFVSALPIAFVYVGLGDRDRAFEWLDRAAEEKAARLVYLKVEHAFDPIRSDPRFESLLRRLGFSG